MPDAICNTSPLLYLHRLGVLDWLGQIFDEIWIPTAVTDKLREGRDQGYDVPDPAHYAWLQIVDPGSIPSEWLSLELGWGERSVMALALENPDRVILLDDALARRIAEAAGLRVWGTLRILLTAKEKGLITSLDPLLDHLQDFGMWISADVRRRVLTLAGEQSQ